MIRVKKGVVFKAFRVEMIKLLSYLKLLSDEMSVDIWITSANDSKHDKPGSYHYLDLAIDTRIRNLTENQIQYIIEQQYGAFFKLFFGDKGSYYDIVLERKKNHIHWEFDERRYLREGG
jgi:hypothetical protein